MNAIEKDLRERVHGASSPPLALLDAPLEYVLAHHSLQRALCLSLKTFAAAGWAPAPEALAVAAYLSVELPMHHRDEDLDLFPAMRRRAKPEDDLAVVLDRLTRDHKKAALLSMQLAAALSRPPMRGRVALDSEIARTAETFATNQHEHVAIENGVVLAIAPQRLTRRDIAAISRSMKARRGLGRLSQGDAA